MGRAGFEGKFLTTNGHRWTRISGCFLGIGCGPRSGGEVGCGVIIPALALRAFCWDGWGRGFFLDLVGGMAIMVGRVRRRLGRGIESKTRGEKLEVVGSALASTTRAARYYAYGESVSIFWTG